MTEHDPNAREPVPFENAGSGLNQAAFSEFGGDNQQFVGPTPLDPAATLRQLLDASNSNEELLTRLEGVAGVAAPPLVEHTPMESTDPRRARLHAVLEAMGNLRNASGLFGHLLDVVDSIQRASPGMTYSDAMAHLQGTVALMTDANSQQVLSFLANSPRLDNGEQ